MGATPRLLPSQVSSRDMSDLVQDRHLPGSCTNLLGGWLQGTHSARLPGAGRGQALIYATMASLAN